MVRKLIITFLFSITGISIAGAIDKIVENKDGYTYETYRDSNHAYISVDSLLYREKESHRLCRYRSTDFEIPLRDKLFEISEEVFPESKYKEIRSNMKQLSQLRLYVDSESGELFLCQIQTDTVTMKYFTKDDLDRLFSSWMNIRFTIDKELIECYEQEDGRKTLLFTVIPFIRRRPVE